MNGRELSKGYFETYGRPMLERDFPDLLPLLAAGLVGRGSECFGYDDASSRDHDFEPGFCLFLPGEEVVTRREAFLLERAYAKLPKEYEGVRRNLVNPVGGARHGVFRTEEFYQKHIGGPAAPTTYDEWKALPEYARAEAVNGDLYFDNYGQFSAIRDAVRLLPEDVRRKRLAGQLLLAAQAGQYNYARCLGHGEPGAAQLAAVAFVQAALAAIFLLNNHPMPFYKWQFRALRELPVLSSAATDLEFLLCSGNQAPEAAKKQEKIERLSTLLIAEVKRQGLSGTDSPDLERHAYDVNDSITDADIRNRHILDAT